MSLRKQNIKNLNTEKEGIVILRKLVDGFMVPDKDQRLYLYNILDIDYKKYSRSIDGVIIHVSSFDDISSKEDFTLVEIKTTSSNSVKELPYGVFFGFTKNEEDLFRTIDNYRLCIVHTKLKKHILLTYKEYKSLIQNKRIQYQINFKSKN
tara:strand:+ start:846 stop:1298 length:453 start_codon:yes stop_codon:yes gene_type:complete